jgi:hypothetical protein
MSPDSATPEDDQGLGRFMSRRVDPFKFEDKCLQQRGSRGDDAGIRRRKGV